MPYYFHRKSQICYLNAIFYWKLAQLLLEGITVEKLNNPLRGVLFYFHTMVPIPNKQKLSTFFYIGSVLLFIFLIAYLFLYIFGLLLLECCHFLRFN